MSRATTRHVRHAKPTAHVTPCRAAPGAPQIHVGPRTAMPPMPSPGPRPLPARHAPCPARSTPLHHVVPGHDHGPAPRAQALPVHRPDVARASGQLHALTTGRKKARTCRADCAQKKRPRRALCWDYVFCFSASSSSNLDRSHSFSSPWLCPRLSNSNSLWCSIASIAPSSPGNLTNNSCQFSAVKCFISPTPLRSAFPTCPTTWSRRKA